MLTVDPFVAGIFCTLFVEMAVVFAGAVISLYKKDKEDRR